MRLQKYLASCGVASRRKSEDLIAAGRVRVNGVVVRIPGTTVNSDDIICYDDKEVIPLNKKYLVLNKPAGYLCTKYDSYGRNTIYDLLNDELYNLFYVGRLDFQSSGLILLTNDGEFANNIIHPSKGVVKEYYVVADRKEIPESLLTSFREGVFVDGILYKALSIGYGASRKEVFIELNEGKKREIRMVFKNFKISLEILRRVRIGKMTLSELGISEGSYKLFSKDQLKGLIYGDKH